MVSGPTSMVSVTAPSANSQHSKLMVSFPHHVDIKLLNLSESFKFVRLDRLRRTTKTSLFNTASLDAFAVVENNQ